MKNSLIGLENVSLGYHRKTVLSSLDFDICEGDFLGIVGPNGSGKTTLLKAILGTLKPLKGKITFSAKNKNEHQLRFGYVPQRGQLDEIYPFTVKEIVMMGRYAQIGKLKKPGKTDHHKVKESLDHLDISKLATTLYKNLSGGQKQRALIARALVCDPDILILDEPTEGLDLFSQHAILELIQHFHKEHRMTVIMVSHHLDQVGKYVKKLALVQNRSFLIGDTESILTSKNLGRLFGLPIAVKNVGGKKLIIPGEQDD